MPPLDVPVWLWDGERIWVGGRSQECEGWLWCQCYNSFWWNGEKWDADFESDGDYKPLLWAPLIDPPKIDFHSAGSDALGARAATTREGH
jgi:hypothetical protein